MQEVKVPTEHQSLFERYLTKQGVAYSVATHGPTTTFKSQQSLKMLWHTFKKTNHLRQGETNGSK